MVRYAVIILHLMCLIVGADAMAEALPGLPQQTLTKIAPSVKKTLVAIPLANNMPARFFPLPQRHDFKLPQRPAPATTLASAEPETPEPVQAIRPRSISSTGMSDEQARQILSLFAPAD